MKDYLKIPVVENHLNYIYNECKVRLKELDNQVIDFLTEIKNK